MLGPLANAGRDSRQAVRLAAISPAARVTRLSATILKQEPASLGVAFDGTSPGEDRCPVCDLRLDMGALRTTTLQFSRGREDWARCRACHSFFRGRIADFEQEAGHTNTRVWGNIETGLAWRGQVAAVRRDSACAS